MPETSFEELLGERLANLHPLTIISEIMLPAIDQIIEDFEDALDLPTDNDNDIFFWKGIRSQIKERH